MSDVPQIIEEAWQLGHLFVMLNAFMLCDPWRQRQTLELCCIHVISELFLRAVKKCLSQTSQNGCKCIITDSYIHLWCICWTVSRPVTDGSACMIVYDSTLAGSSSAPPTVLTRGRSSREKSSEPRRQQPEISATWTFVAMLSPESSLLYTALKALS